MQINISNYSPDIQDRYDFAMQSFEQKRKWIDDLSTLLSERADIEAGYSKSLQKLATQFEKYSTKNSLEKGLIGIISGVRSVILTQSEQATAQSESLKSEVVAMLKSGVRKQSDELASLKMKVGFLKMELSRNLGELEKQKQEYYRNYKMFVRSREYLVGLQLHEASPMGSVLQENENLLAASQLVLGDSIKFYNSFLEQYFNEIAQAHTLHETMEDARVDLIKDALLKSLVFQISAIKNVEYDTNQVAKKIETYARIDAKQIFFEPNVERMMLSKLNFNNYVQYVHSECAIPQVDRALQKADLSTSLNLSNEINKSLKKFLDAFGPKKPASQAARAGSSGFSPNDVTSSGYYYSLLNDVFFNQQYLDGLSISKFKETIESNEKELIHFAIALHNFSHTTQSATYTQASEKAIGDLAFLILYIFDQVSRESDLIERCYVNFSKICKNFLKESVRYDAHLNSLKQHTVLKSFEFWAQDSIKRIQQAESRQKVSRGVLMESQIKLDIARWRNMDFSKQFQLDILDAVADAAQIEPEKRTFYSNVITEKERFSKKPIFASSSMPSKNQPGISQIYRGVEGGSHLVAPEGVPSVGSEAGSIRNDKIQGEIEDVADNYDFNAPIEDFKPIQPPLLSQGKTSNVISSIGKEDAI